MKKMILTLTSTAVMCFSSIAQQVVSVTPIGTKTKAQLATQFSLPIFKCGVSYYKLTYTSVDAKGQADTLSGLLVTPDDLNATYPVLMYEHGTSDCKTCVPSRYEQAGGDEGQAGLLFGGMGYVALLPDYVGMGDGRGFQTYVHYSTTISATEGMLKAFRNWAPANNIHLNNQLFITGYSQGGYASMAFQKHMQSTYGSNSVTAAAHNSGPYSLSGAMRDLILVDSAYSYPAYIPNTMLGMNEFYEMYSDLNDFFKPEFINDIQSYYDGTLKLTALNARIIDTLVAYYGASIAHHMIKDDVLNDITNNPNYIVNQILKDNDVYNWKPESPTRIFYCKADDQVPYVNSVIAIDTMYAKGADQNLVMASDLDPTQDHAGCVQPAFTQTILFFANYQSTTLATTELNNSSLIVYPNPANDKLFITTDLSKISSYTITDLNGKIILHGQKDDLSNEINISKLENGIYLLTLELTNNYLAVEKFVVQK